MENRIGVRKATTARSRAPSGRGRAARTLAAAALAVVVVGPSTAARRGSDGAMADPYAARWSGGEWDDERLGEALRSWPAHASSPRLATWDLARRVLAREVRRPSPGARPTLRVAARVLARSGVDLGRYGESLRSLMSGVELARAGGDAPSREALRVAFVAAMDEGWLELGILAGAELAALDVRRGDTGEAVAVVERIADALRSPAQREAYELADEVLHDRLFDADPRVFEPFDHAAQVFFTRFDRAPRWEPCVEVSDDELDRPDVLRVAREGRALVFWRDQREIARWEVEPGVTRFLRVSGLALRIRGATLATLVDPPSEGAPPPADPAVGVLAGLARGETWRLDGRGLGRVSGGTADAGPR